MPAQIGAALGEDQAGTLRPAVHWDQHRGPRSSVSVERLGLRGAEQQLRSAQMIIWTIPPSTPTPPRPCRRPARSRGRRWRRDLIHLGQAADRALRAGGLEGLLAAGQPPSPSTWSSSPPSSIQSSDLTGPGQIALTSTPRAAYRSAKRRESESSAALATEYSGIAAEGRLPAVLETLTTRPQPRSRMPGIAARISRIGAITLSSKAAYQSSSGTSSRSRRRARARVVDQHVHAAEALDRLADDRARRRRRR